MNEVLKGDEVNSTIYKQELQETIEYVLRVENVLYMNKCRVLVKLEGFMGRLKAGLIKPNFCKFL